MIQRTYGTKRPMNEAGGVMRRSVVLLASLLLVCVLMAGAVSATDTTATVSSYSELVGNLSDSTVTKIVLNGEITTSAPIFVNRSVEIDGQYHTITADNTSGTFTWKSGHSSGNDCYHLLEIIELDQSGAVTLSNVTFENVNASYGLNFWNDTANHGQTITLTNVVINASHGSGLTMRGVNVSATNLTITNSGWEQSIDIQKTTNVVSNLTIDFLEKLQDPTQISDEANTEDNQVFVSGTAKGPTHSWFLLDEGNYKQQRIVWATATDYPTKAGFGIFNASVQNTTGPVALHTNLTQAINTYAASGAIVTLLKDVTVTGYDNNEITLSDSKKLTLNLNQKHLDVTGSATSAKDAKSAYFINVTDSADLKITGNGWFNVTNTTGNTKWGRGIMASGGNLTVENANFNMKSTLIRAAPSSHVTITGGNFNSEADYGIVVDGDGTEANSPKLTISGAKINAHWGAIGSIGNYDDSRYTIDVSDSTLTSSNVVMYLPSYGVVNLNNVTVTGPNGITIDAGELTIAGSSVISGTATNNVAAILNNDGSPEGDNGVAITLEKGSAGKRTADTDGEGYYGNLNVTIKDNAIIVSTNGVAIRNYITDKNLVRYYNSEEVTQVVNVVVKDNANVSGNVADIAYQNYTNTQDTNVQFVGFNQTANFVFPAAYAHFPLKVQYDNVTTLNDGIHSVKLDLKSGALTDTFTITKGNITLPKGEPTKGTEKFTGWELGTSFFTLGDKVKLDATEMIFNATYAGSATITIAGNTSVENGTTTPEWTPLTASLSSGSSAAFTWSLVSGSESIISLNKTDGATIGYKPLKVGTATLKVSAGSVAEKTITITVYETAKAELPITNAEKKSDGTTVIGNSSADGITITDKFVTIKDTDNDVTMKVTFAAAPTVNAGENITGTVSTVEVIYPQKILAADQETAGKGQSAYHLTLELNDVTTILPIITPVINTTKEAKITALPGQFKVAAMIEAVAPAGETLESINNNISANGIQVMFMIPKDSWIAAIAQSKIVAYHIPDDGTAPDKLNIVMYDSTGTHLNITVKGNTFSGIALTASTYTAPYVPPVNPPVSSGSGDGNMDGAYRVLFETQGGSSVTPATGLSAGDKITAPANPVRDGYTFGGWYKDAACTQGWSFSDGIPGDMTLYAKWTGGSSGAQGSSGSPSSSTQPTAKQTTAPVQTQSQSGASATTAAPVTTTAAGSSSPAMTQAPAPVFGALLGLLAAGVLLRRRE